MFTAAVLKLKVLDQIVTSVLYIHGWELTGQGDVSLPRA